MTQYGSSRPQDGPKTLLTTVYQQQFGLYGTILGYTGLSWAILSHLGLDGAILGYVSHLGRYGPILGYLQPS